MLSWGMGSDLVPITLLLELKDRYSSDTFLWDARQGAAAMLEFAAGYCRDSAMNQVHAQTLAAEMQRQAEAWTARSLAARDGDGGGGGGPAEAVAGRDGAGRPRSLCVISLDCWVGTHQLQDSFLWDLGDASASPEGFACQMAQELGLDGRAGLAIAIAIRRQLAAHTQGRAKQARTHSAAHIPSLWYVRCVCAWGVGWGEGRGGREEGRSEEGVLRGSV